MAMNDSSQMRFDEYEKLLRLFQKILKETHRIMEETNEGTQMDFVINHY